MLINLKVKTLDAQTHDFSIDNEITVREFKDKVAERTNIAADQQRIIYCGRVMVDDKQLKEYDVDGKVVHVAERPPPSQRLPSSETSGSNGNLISERRGRARAGAGGMRNSPLFRALDGMVVGTMAFPVNATTNGQTPVNPLAASSSFCMNRITVARHMLDCANNIAAFLEDPSRGLNNQSLDILARGRWTMESTVVEVGITSDIPQSQQIVEMVQGAVQAALRRNGNTNVTLVQLPTVYSSSEGDANNATAAAAANANATDAATADSQNTAAASVVIEDVIDEDEDDDTPTNEQNTDNNTSTPPPAAADMGVENAGGSTSATEDGNTDQSRRRTGTRVLGRVIEQMRNVQNRLNPFVQQYHELLQNEPDFEEDDVTGRENAQRLFDRVSEAFHYLSHAQHAISDLMLDISQPSPRFLTCRPILVEQSGYVSSNNFITPAMIPAALHQQQQPSRSSSTTTGTPPNANTTTSPATSANTSDTSNSTAASISTNSSTANSTNDANNSTVDDPIDDPVTWPPTINFGLPPSNDNNTSSAANNNATGRVPAPGGTLEIVLQPTRAQYIERNFQRQVARLLQDVVSAAPFDTEFHVHINSPNVLSIDVPINGPALAAAAGLSRNTTANNTDNNTATTDNNATTPEATTPTTNDSATATATASTPSNANPARVTTATLPTTSTQTRSTARPQVHIGNIPVLGMPSGWNGRALPTNNVSSFDRFLPCNSHHVRDHESASRGATNVNNTGNSNHPNATVAAIRANRANIITRRPLRAVGEMLQRIRHGPSRIIVGPRSTNNASSSGTRQAPVFNFSSQSSTTPPPQNVQAATALRNLLDNSRMNQGYISSYPAPMPSSPIPVSRRINMHTQFLNFVKNHIFEGKPINDENMTPAINRAIQWFGESLIYLPQYEKPEYDSRDSLFNILRNTLPLFIRLVNRNPMNLTEFEQKLKDICEQVRKRMYSVLYVCIGRANAELYWSQLMRLLCVSIESNLDDEVVEFLTLYLNPNIPNGTDEADAQQFIAYRNSSNSSNSVEMPMDTDVEMVEVASTSQPEVDDEPLPTVVPDSAAWHRNFPNDWLPIITRDIHRQTDNRPNQPAYSDAYISGMSSKRRKLIQHTKPPTEITALIADSVSKAIHNAGVGTSTSSNQTQTPDEIARVIANDANVQSSCTEAVRVNVRERLKNESDYEPEKFPKSTKFIQK